MFILVLQRGVLKRVHSVRFHVPVLNLRMKKVMMVGSHGPILIAQNWIIRHVNKNRVIEQSGHLAVVQFVLDEDSIGLHQQRQCAKDIEIVRHRNGHGRFGKIHHDQIKGAEPLFRDEGETLGRIAEPPLNARILKVRLRMKVLQTLAHNLLIQFQSQYQFHVGIFERFVQQHGVSSPDEDDALHFLQIRRGEMHVGFVVVRAVGVANLQDVVEAHADVGLVGVLAPGHLLVEGSGFVDGVLEAGEFEVGFASGRRFFLAFFHFVRVGVAGSCALFVVAGVFLVVILFVVVFAVFHHVGIGTYAVAVGFGSSGTFGRCSCGEDAAAACCG
mmetsp:Transcript_20586/g.43238  ORF Transcript_20586/g.43238 Transcript_20586/m.43238 type:complete len:330 (-) Transcript_20586:130-1119(-)